jgi:competence protein ComEC
VTDYEYCGAGSVRLTIKGKINGDKRTSITLYTTDKNYDYYDNVSAKCKVAIPDNTVRFDSEDYSRSQGIYLVGTGTAECEKTGGCKNLLMRAVKKFRQYTINRISLYCGEQSGAFLTAILCAEKSKVSRANITAIYRSGLGHLFAVSGTHVVIISSLVQFFLSRLIASVKKRSIVSLAIIWCFALFAGMSTSVVRTCVIMSISLTAVFFRRHGDSANSLGMAAVILTLSCPFVITSASFILSFTAAFAIGVIAPAVCFARTDSSFGKTFISYICINICSISACAYFFSEISTVSIISNLLMIPLCTVSLSLSFIYMITGSTLTVFIKAADFLAKLILRMCVILTKYDFSYFGTRSEIMLIISGFICILVLVCFALKKKKLNLDLYKITAVYLAFCIEGIYLSNVQIKDKIFILPYKSNYTAVLISDGKAAIFDMGSCGKLGYPTENLLEKYHVSDSYVFMSDKPVYTRISYQNRLSLPTNYYSLSISTDDIMQIDGTLILDNIQVQSLSGDYDGYKITIGENTVTLSDEHIIVNGKDYDSDSFTWSSKFILS